MPDTSNISAAMSKRKQGKSGQNQPGNRGFSSFQSGKPRADKAPSRRTDPAPERSPAPFREKPHGRGQRPGGNDAWLYGFHAVLSALKNKARRPERLLLAKGIEAELAKEGLSLGTSLPLSPEILALDDITRLLPPGAVHQGIALKTQPLPELTLDEACEDTPLVVVLDQVTDPHNLGAILRSSAVFGAGAIIMTERHSPPMTGVVAKAASGALEHVKIAKITNLVRALDDLKDLGFEVIGLDGEGDTALTDAKLGPKVALVMGAEGAGLRRLTREHCDWLARLPASGPMRSLNVSNAAAVALYEVARRNVKV